MEDRIWGFQRVRCEEGELKLTKLTSAHVSPSRASQTTPKLGFPSVSSTNMRDKPCSSEFSFIALVCMA
jgi:hypothetical protein